MNLIRAEIKAKHLVKELEEFCEKIEVVGSIRRKKDDVKDIDILLAPKTASLFGLMRKITELGSENSMRAAGKKVIVLEDELGKIKAELWFTSLDKWSVMLLVRTGGSTTNKKIANLCQQKGWHLSVSEGSIYDENGKKLTIEKEEDIFKLLEIKYITPDWRD